MSADERERASDVEPVRGTRLPPGRSIPRGELRSLFEVCAQEEALRISDRTKAGLERARKQGKVLGRPDGFERWAPVLVEMKEREFSQGQMSRETGLSYNTVKKYLRRLHGTE